MQPGTNPEDIHTILSRFNHWADASTANGNGHAESLKSLGLENSEAGVREIPYEEAMRRLRSRRGGAARAEAALTASEERQPVAAAEATSVAGPMKAAAMDGVLESKVRSTEKSMRRVLGEKPAAKKSAKIAKAATPAAAPMARPRKPEGKTEPAPAPEFRQVLAKTVRKAKPAARNSTKKEKGRDQRVSVRLSRAEEQRLQACAAMAGVTVSQYLRMRALEGAASVGIAHHVAADPICEATAASATAAPATPAKSSLGDWLALLRNRFLASPGRFAERA